MRTKILPVLILFFITAPSAKADIALDPVAEEIRTNFESQLFTLEPYLQRHYALRLYRITGDEKYIYPIISDLMIIANLIEKDARGLNSPVHRKAREAIILDRFNLTKEKHLKRFTLLKAQPGMAFSLALLANLTMVNEVGLLNSYFFDTTDHIVAYLREQQFETFFLNPDVVKIYSPQLATYVYFLFDLGIVDLRQRFTEVFKRVFVSTDDHRLSDLIYAQKLYGMTHFIIGASRNYQRTVNRNEFDWIYDYFEKNIDSIVRRAKADIVAEVGIAFLLAGESNHPAVAAARKAVRQRYDPVHRLIPSTSGSTELSGGEHRNVLAIMLLTWSGQLYPGPNLSRSPQYESFWLKDYLP
ncbi:MAG: DUF3541 domain-containing protein [Pseudomonadota bacterium]